MTILKKLLLASAVGLATIASAQAQETVRFWYHFDNPDNPMTELVAKFESENPGIKIQPENIPWNGYYDNLYVALAGGNAPDAAMVKLFAQPRLLEMGVLEPIGDRVDTWEGKEDLLDNLLNLTRASDGNQYYLPLQYVVLYLYYRTDLFEAAGLQPPTTCDEFRTTAKALTKAPDTYGYGFRGGSGGWDHWGAFVLSRGAKLEPGGLDNPQAIAANQWVIDLFREDGSIPPSAPNDGYQEITAAIKSGKTAMTIHHIGSSNDLVAALGDKISAVPVPKCDGNAWTSFGDESNAIFASSQVKDAAWKWISFLSQGENNVKFQDGTGQLTVTKSGSENWTKHEKRFMDATIASLPFAATLPPSPATTEFVSSAWQTAMQQAMTGQITSEQMMQQLQRLFP